MEKSRNIYNYPFPKGTKVGLIVKENQAHVGPFQGALDFSVELGTQILAPLDGEIIEIVDKHKKYGPSKSYTKYLNFITIKHSHGEYSQLCHLSQESSLVKAGDRVKEGQQITATGNSGWMTAPHVHMFVFKLTKTKPGFQGLEIRFNTT